MRSGEAHRARQADLVKVEGGFPDRDPAVAHQPDLDAAPSHLFAGHTVLPFAFPRIGDRVAHQDPQLLAQPIVLLPFAAPAQQLFEGRLAAKFRQSPKRTTQSSVKPARRPGRFHGMNSDWTCATKARASLRVCGLRAGMALPKSFTTTTRRS